jgi:hypothetical protein
MGIEDVTLAAVFAGGYALYSLSVCNSTKLYSRTVPQIVISTFVGVTFSIPFQTSEILDDTDGDEGEYSVVLEFLVFFVLDVFADDARVPRDRASS